MARTSLTDGSGWFDDETSVMFSEDTWWDGSNHISRATDSQWNHERLYYTQSGNFVLNAWSQYEGVPETYHTISPRDAVLWLIRNNYTEETDLTDLPVKIRSELVLMIEEAEV